MLKFQYREHVRNFVKISISNNPVLYSIYSAYSLSKQHRLFLKKINKICFQERFLSRKDVVEQIRQRKEKKSSNVCHVIGSGWSLNHSAKNINAQDFIIGFNYAAISELDFDVYFFEFGGQKVKEISYNHLALAQEKVVSKTDLIYFKNIWEDKNDIDFILSNWIGLARPVIDHYYSALDKRNLEKALTYCLNERSKYIPQICSTVVTAVVLAYQAGFEKIVIHGLDFGGQYFYECMEADANPRFLPPSKPVSGFYGKTSKEDVHPTALAAVGMQDIIPVLYNLLERKNVALMCGSEDSPSSEYLPVYRV